MAIFILFNQIVKKFSLQEVGTVEHDKLKMYIATLENKKRILTPTSQHTQKLILDGP